MREVVAVQRKRFPFKNAVTQLRHTYLGKVEPGISGIELLSAAPLVVQFGQFGDPLKGGEQIRRCACLSGKAVKQGLVDVEHFRGFRDGEHVQPAVCQTAFLNERLYIAGKLLFREVVVKVGKQVLLPELNGQFGIAGKDIRHIRCAGVAVDDHGKALVQLGAGRNGGNVNDDTLLLAHRGIELVDQVVHGLLHIAAVVVPHGQGHRLFGVERRVISAAGKAAQHKQKGQKYRSCFFHGVYLRSLVVPLPIPILF